MIHNRKPVDFAARYGDCARVSRDRARELNQPVFWPDEPCKRGHMTWRRTNNRECIMCARASNHRAKAKRAQARYGPLGRGARHQELAREAEQLKRELEDW